MSIETNQPTDENNEELSKDEADQTAGGILKKEFEPRHEHHERGGWGGGGDSLGPNPISYQ